MHELSNENFSWEISVTQIPFWMWIMCMTSVGRTTLPPKTKLTIQTSTLFWAKCGCTGIWTKTPLRSWCIAVLASAERAQLLLFSTFWKAWSMRLYLKKNWKVCHTMSTDTRRYATSQWGSACLGAYANWGNKECSWSRSRPSMFLFTLTCKGG